MKCPDARALLPEYVYAGLPPERHKAVEAHLAGCAACRAEVRELQNVRRLLGEAAAPEVRVDVAALYREAAARQARRARRWRRLTAAACVAAAAAVLAAAASRLEVRVEAHQVVLRWGDVPAPDAPPDGAALAHVPPPPAPQPPAVTEEQLRLLGELVQALAADVWDRDVRRQAEIVRLRALLVDLQEHDARRWSAAERDIDAMYAAQFGRKKGE